MIYSATGAETKTVSKKHSTLKHILLSLAAAAATSVLIYLLKIPNPVVFLLTEVAIFTSLYGYHGGIPAGAVTVIYSMFFFSTDQSFIRYTSENIQKLAIIVLGTIINLWFIGHLKKKNNEANRKLEEMNRILILDNFALQEATTTDSLTGVKNRFAFRRDYVGYAGKELHVMMIDIDNFKSINDTYGHTTGDYILKKLGGSLAEVFGKERSYRYGGDEFLVVTEYMEEGMFKDCISVLYGLLKNIKCESGQLSVDLSAGYVYGNCSEPDDLRLMLRQADSKLYEIKRAEKKAFAGCAYSRAEAEKLKKDPKEAIRRV